MGKGSLRHRRRGAVLVLLVLALFVILAMGALVVDSGLARWQRARIAGAADAAALEGLRNGREAARQFAGLALDTDWDVESGDEWTLELNAGNAPRGDLVAGRYLPGESHAVGEDGRREDFEPGAANADAFIVRIRATGGEQQPGVASNREAVPFVFGQTVNRPREARETGIGVQATAIARWNRALSVGRAYPELGLVGAAPIAMDRATWEGLIPGTEAEFQATETGSVRLFVPRAISAGEAFLAQLPTEFELPAAPREGYAVIFAALPGEPEATGRAVGFGRVQFRRVGGLGNQFPARVVVTRLASQRAPANATVALTGEMAPLSEPGARLFLREFDTLRTGLLAPGLVRAESR
ncbi:MAG: pilus assembly protein TadG-related protein [Sumerlaeia bacterium]